MLQPKVLVTAISYLLPYTLEKKLSKLNGVLKIVVIKGELLLASKNAYYSKGTSYMPFTITYKYLNNCGCLPVDNYLFLGGGIGSCVSLLKEKYNIQPTFTIVELDPIVVALALKYNPFLLHKNATVIQQDAIDFINNTKAKYNFIGVDIFIDLSMPSTVTSNVFLQKIKTLLLPTGIVMFNTYFKKEKEFKDFENVFTKEFKLLTNINKNNNSIWIGTIN